MGIVQQYRIALQKIYITKSYPVGKQEKSTDKKTTSERGAIKFNLNGHLTKKLRALKALQYTNKKISVVAFTLKCTKKI